MSEAVGRREFGLGWALAAALVLHVLLLGLSLVVPLFERVRDVPPEEQRITFSLSQPTTIDEPVEQSAPPAPSLPTPQAQRAEPTLEPPSMASEPSVATPPVERVAQRERASQPLEVVEPAPPRTDPVATPVPDTLPETAAADLGRGESDAPQPTPPRPGSLRGALRDFRSAVESTPPPTRAAERAAARAPTNVFVPDMSQVPITGSQLGELTFESRDFDWSDYGRQIYMAIWRAWHRRLHASTDEFERWAHANSAWFLDHQTGVRFVIERSGRVVGIVVELPGGCEPLDRSAADALAEVLLPPLPGDFPRDREVVHARFVIRGEVRSMRPILRRMKANGLF